MMIIQYLSIYDKYDMVSYYMIKYNTYLQYHIIQYIIAIHNLVSCGMILYLVMYYNI